MAEYIEREAAIAFMNEVEPCICHDSDGAVFTATKDSNMLEFLRAIPAADVVPVRHGKWIVDSIADNIYHCNKCGNDAPVEPTGGVEYKSNYCPTAAHS